MAAGITRGAYATLTAAESSTLRSASMPKGYSTGMVKGPTIGHMTLNNSIYKLRTKFQDK